jgi:hypothetical protein
LSSTSTRSALAIRFLAVCDQVAHDVHAGDDLFHQPLAVGVKVAGGFVREQHGRPLVQGPGDEQALFMAAGDVAGTFCHG